MNVKTIMTEKQIYWNYTLDTPCVVEGKPNARKVWLKVDGQSFCLDFLADNKKEANWMRHQLSKALLKIY